MSFIIILRGGGDLASGVAVRLYRAGLRVAITELPQPKAVRRLVSFAEAVYTGETVVEGITGKRVTDPGDTLQVLRVFAKKQIPVLVDPDFQALGALHPTVVIDGRMNKRPPKLGLQQASLVIGLGPGFEAGVNSHAVVETKRGHRLGRVIWKGLPEADTGIPESVDQHGNDRVLRAPADGILVARKEICNHIEEGEVVAEVAGLPIQASFTGILRGLLHPGLPVTRGMKVGDIDPRDDPSFCTLVSDKALAIGGGVLEAIFSRPDLRPLLWT
jgi:xanthine dehydrogenase accessory factor